MDFIEIAVTGIDGEAAEAIRELFNRYGHGGAGDARFAAEDRDDHYAGPRYGFVHLCIADRRRPARHGRAFGDVFGVWAG